MVKLEHVNKYFFRRRRNEIHVINDTSMFMEKTGLVALLGPSGSGKTTLLNVIGGLDKPGSGKVYVNGKKLNGFFSGKTDKIRTLNIGYIFQNYNLVDNMTVFDNVALALKMTGIKDKKEIEEKVNYVLEKVGMYRYRNRFADMLSGGERQRVGIARAIVKNPAIIIADEPTGNLDSRNTLEVMKIIKSISRDRLVILVTHEEQLADFYASRIIRLRDGRVISDELNDHDDSLDYRIENKIYLKDIEDHSRLDNGVFNVDFYNESDGTLDLDIVLRNGNIYIRTNNPENRIEIVDDDSAIEFVDDHYRKLTQEEAMEQAIDLTRLETDRKRRYRSILNPWTLIRRGFRTVASYNVLKKVLLAGFCISAMFITYAVSMFFGVTNITDDEFAGADKSYLTVVGKNISVNTYLGYEANDEYRYVMPGSSQIAMNMNFDQYIQTKDVVVTLAGSLSDSEKLKRDDLKCGRLPENDREIVVDKQVLKKAIDEQSTVELGAGKIRSFLDREVTVENMGHFTIVGVSDLLTPCIYADRDQFINLIANCLDGDEYNELGDLSGEEEDDIGLIDYKLKKSKVTLKKGDWPKDNYEVLVNYKNKDDSDFKIGKKIKEKVNHHRLKIVGYYTDPYDSDFLLVNNEMIKYSLLKSKENVTICPVNKEGALNRFKEEGVNVKDTYQQSRDRYIKDKWASMKAMLIMAAVILAISFIEIFLMIRASFLSRIREVGVYRAIGVKKRDIYKMFSGEIIAISTLASLPGVIIMGFILKKVSSLSLLADMFMIDPKIIGICIVIVYVLNLLVGLLPVWKTIRRTPAAILARNDI